MRTTLNDKRVRLWPIVPVDTVVVARLLLEVERPCENARLCKVVGCHAA